MDIKWRISSKQLGTEGLVKNIDPFMLYDVLNNISNTKLAAEFAAYLEGEDYKLEAIANQRGMQKDFVSIKIKSLNSRGWGASKN